MQPIASWYTAGSSRSRGATGGGGGRTRRVDDLTRQVYARVHRHGGASIHDVDGRRGCYGAAIGGGEARGDTRSTTGAGPRQATTARSVAASAVAVSPWRSPCVERPGMWRGGRVVGAELIGVAAVRAVGGSW